MKFEEAPEVPLENITKQTAVHSFRQPTLFLTDGNPEPVSGALYEAQS